MKLAESVKQLIVRYVAKYPAVVGEDAWRTWIHRLCEQLAFTFPAAGWGHKGAPHSKDCIAIRSPFIGWDIVVASGSTSPSLNLNADSQDLSGQVFEPVTPVNHLGDGPVDPVDPVDPVQPPPVSLAAVEAKLDAILAELVRQRAAIERVATDLPAAIAGGIKIRF